uniref:Uncharacterized protein n=1 Tax=Arundo donax TaxID=35708 RepID=A0A0A8XR57_ARUDO
MFLFLKLVYHQINKSIFLF